MASRISLDTADKLDIICKRGDTFMLQLRMKDSNGVPIQLATLGYTFLMQVRNPNDIIATDDSGTSAKARVILSTPDAKEVVSRDGQTETNLSFDNITVDDNGNVTIIANNNVMKQINPGRYVYDIQSVSSGVYKTIVKGSFSVNDDITQV